MKEQLVGFEHEYGLNADIALLESMKDVFAALSGVGSNTGIYTTFILKQVKSILPDECFIETHRTTGEFWTRAGFRTYPDRSQNLEVATAECPTFSDLIVQKNTGHALMQALIEKAGPRIFEAGYSGPLEVYANNTAVDFAKPLELRADSEALFGCHENYLLRRDLYPQGLDGGQNCYECIFENAGAFFIARPVLGGAGHITPQGTFVLSPRMSWIKEAVSGATTQARPLVNHRNEAHADYDKFFRYHHIAGDTNITDNICRMKIAFTYWVLRMIERGWRAPLWLRAEKASFVAMANIINSDPKLENSYFLSRKRITAVELLEFYLTEVDKMRKEMLFDEEDDEIFKSVASYIGRAKKGPEEILGESEWATKHVMLEARRTKLKAKDMKHPLLRNMSIAFHNLDQNPETNPFIKIRNKVLPENLKIENLAKACSKAPGSRAFARGLAVFLCKKFDLPLGFFNSREWVTLILPNHPSLPDRAWSSLDSLTPWTISAKDLKMIREGVKPWVKDDNIDLRQKAKIINENYQLSANEE